MKALGFVTRALVIELIAIGSIVWFATSEFRARDQVMYSEPSVVQVAGSDAPRVTRKAYVASRLEGVAARLRTTANQFVDETLATWFDK